MACPCAALRGRAIRWQRRGMPRLYFTGYACCGLSAAIPHADRCAYIYAHARVRHAEGMRACTHGALHRSDSVARSTPTAQQERPNKTLINKVLMHHPKIGIERSVFLPHFTRGWVNPSSQKNTYFALNMRRAAQQIKA